MIQMDIPAAYVCSQIFAYCGKDWLVNVKPSCSGRYTVLAVSYALGIIGACGLYLYSGWTEWEMMYWFEKVRMETANFGNPWLALIGPLFLLALGAASLIGFMLAHKWIVEKKPKKVLISLFLGAAVSLIMVLFTPSAPMLVGHYYDYHSYVDEAVSSANPWDYGIIALGAWKFCVPWAANEELLAKHELVTFFNPRFFVPWLIDILIFFGTAFALAIWYKRHKLEH